MFPCGRKFRKKESWHVVTSLAINGGGCPCMCLKTSGGEGREGKRKEEVSFQAERRYSVF